MRNTLLFIFGFFLYLPQIGLSQVTSADTTKFSIKLSFNYNQVTLFNVNTIEDSLIVHNGERFDHYGTSLQYFITTDKRNYSLLNSSLKTDTKNYEFGSLIRLTPINPNERNKLDATRYWRKNFYLSTDPESRVYINDEYISTGPSLLNVKDGDKIKLKNENFDYELNIRPKEQFKSLFETQTISFRPDKMNMWKKMWIPGLYQLERRSYFRAFAFPTLIIASIMYSSNSYADYKKANDKFIYYKNQYNRSIDPTLIMQVRYKAIEYKSISNSKLTTFKQSIGIPFILYSLNLIDAYFWNGNKYFKKIQFNPYLDTFNETNNSGVTLTYSLN